MAERTASVIGQGVVAPDAHDVRDLRSIAQGVHAASPAAISRFPATGYSCGVAFHADAELKDTERAVRAVARLAELVGARFGVRFSFDVDPVDDATRFLFSCCDQLEEALGGPLPELMRERAGIFIGTCSAQLPAAADAIALASLPDSDSVRILQCAPMLSGTLVKLYLGWDLDDPVSAQVTMTGCTASADAIARAATAVRSGRLDFAVAGGVDVVNEPLLRGFDAAQSLTDAPCRPFDIAHEGFQLGEGAGLIALAASPAGSGGYSVEALGAALDGYHLMLPDPAGTGLGAALDWALAGADGPVGGLIGHGTATPGNDEIELNVYAARLAAGTPVMSVKSVFGHSLGAAGVHNVLTALQALAMEFLPGTVNLRSPIETPLTLSSSAVPLTSPRVAVCSPAFGGHNVALILSRRDTE
jgi:3-oxoacyl-[acyl-carrier-protein] synthase I